MSENPTSTSVSTNVNGKSNIKCPHPDCQFEAKQIQGMVKHLNSKHFGKTTKSMLMGQMSSRIICECGRIGHQGENCNLCQKKTQTSFTDSIPQISRSHPTKKNPENELPYSMKLPAISTEIV